MRNGMESKYQEEENKRANKDKDGRGGMKEEKKNWDEPFLPDITREEKQ